MITFEPFLGGTRVLLDGRRVGVIQEVARKGGGFHYQPKGSKASGKIFGTLQACKDSLGS